MLDVLDITKIEEGEEYLSGVSLRVKGGEIVGLLGAEGAGKRALLEIILGRDRPDAGEVCLGEEIITEYSERRRISCGLVSTTAKEGFVFRKVIDVGKKINSLKGEDFYVVIDSVEDIDEAISNVKNSTDKSVGILFSSTDVRKSLSYLDRAYIIHGGEILISGTPSEICSSDR